MKFYYLQCMWSHIFIYFSITIFKHAEIFTNTCSKVVFFNFNFFKTIYVIRNLCPFQHNFFAVTEKSINVSENIIVNKNTYTEHCLYFDRRSNTRPWRFTVTQSHILSIKRFCQAVNLRNKNNILIKQEQNLEQNRKFDLSLAVSEKTFSLTFSLP